VLTDNGQTAGRTAGWTARKHDVSAACCWRGGTKHENLIMKRNWVKKVWTMKLKYA